MCLKSNGGSEGGEFKTLKKPDLLKRDKGLAKLYQDSEKTTPAYRLPTKPVDGIYTGCKKCSGGINHGGR